MNDDAVLSRAVSHEVVGLFIFVWVSHHVPFPRCSFSLACRYILAISRFRSPARLQTRVNQRIPRPQGTPLPHEFSGTRGSTEACLTGARVGGSGMEAGAEVATNPGVTRARRGG